MPDRAMQTATNAYADKPIALVRGATKHFPGVLALDNVDFEIRPGARCLARTAQASRPSSVSSPERPWRTAET
jgi:hypothetical protein